MLGGGDFVDRFTEKGRRVGERADRSCAVLFPISPIDDLVTDDENLPTPERWRAESVVDRTNPNRSVFRCLAGAMT